MARARRSRRGLSRLVRPLNLIAFLPLASRAPTYGRLLLALLREDRVPIGSKALLAAALGYVALPIDVVPDWLPLVGALDDVAVTVMAVDLFLEAVPRELLDEKLDELAIERAALDRDLAEVRRLVPRPIRRGIALLPRAARAGVDIFRRSGADRRLRTWIINEERSG